MTNCQSVSLKYRHSFGGTNYKGENSRSQADSQMHMNNLTA